MNNTKEIVEAGCSVFVKSLVQILPLGNTAVELYNEMQTKQIERKIRRLEEFYTDLANDVSAQKEKINKEFVSKDDFLDVFEEATRYVVVERQDEKRKYFKNILANSICSTDSDYDTTERYFKILDNLSLQELNILAVLDNPEVYNKTHGMIVKDPVNNQWQTTWSNVMSMGVMTQLLGIKTHQVEDSISVLFSNGLVTKNSMERTLQMNSNPVHVLDNLLTIRGRKFVKYLGGGR